MIHLRDVVGAMAILIAAATCPQKSEAGTTAADFLTWDKTSQDGYIQTSVGMIGVIASQIAPDVANCLNDWYYKSAQSIALRNDEVRRVMSEYGTYHPSTVIFAIAEDRCGRFSKP